MHEILNAALIVALLALVLWVITRPRSNTDSSSKKTVHDQPQKASNVDPKIKGAHKWESLGEFDFEVVGESNYQNALKIAAGNHGSDPADVQCIAALVPEDDNEYDKSAVAVEVGGKTVGYLSRDDARSFRRRLGRKQLSGQVTYCDALIMGGGTSKAGKKYSYGIRLDIKPFE